MSKSYSIAEARDHLAKIVHSVEDSSHVFLTRRGKPVAVLVSAETFDELTQGRSSYWQAIEKFRSDFDLPKLDISRGEVFRGLRDPSPGRAPFVDGQIAAISAVNGLVLVTGNTKDYERFRGLNIENWLDRA